MWRPFDNGTTLGLMGSERGETIRDEEHTLGARITLEKDANIAPFAITCGIYGWMVHTRFFANENEAVAEYDKMKAGLSEIVERFTASNSDDSQAIKAIEAFVETYP